MPLPEQRPASPASASQAGVIQDTSGVLQLDPFDPETVMNTLLEGLSEPTMTKDWRDDLQHMPEGNKTASWQNCFRVVEKHDRDLCQAYREQIDTLLVFAGLFSAVVTAFSIESYQWLQDDPADISVVLLREMVVLMARDSNRTVPPLPLQESRLSDAVIVRVNIFWFVSLCLSLSAALVGILCKQWVREFERDVGLSPEKALAVRQVRFHGLEYWKVGTIITSVPILLQLVLALFLLGIVDLLWRLHAAVAICVTSVAGLTLAFYLSTTFLPLIQYAYICIRCCRAAGPTDLYCRVDAFAAPQCAFKSAQAWIAIRIAQPAIEYCIKKYARCFACYLPPVLYPLELPHAESWIRFDINWTQRRDYLHRGPRAAYVALSWAARHLDEADLSVWIWHCIWSRRWGGMGLVDETGDAANDIACVADAYPRSAKLGTNFPAYMRVQSLAFECSLTAELSADTIIELFLRTALVVGVNSPWTRDALNAIIALYDKRPVSLSDDVSMGLLILAEMQSNEQWHINFQVVTDSRHPRFPFIQIAWLLSRGSRLRGRLLPAMCALALSWLGVQAREPVKLMAREMLDITISHYAHLGYDDRQLLESPGVLLSARFASITSAVWPDFLTWWDDRTEHKKVLYALLSIWSTRNDSSTIRGEAQPGEAADVQSHASDQRVSNSHDDVRGTVQEADAAMAKADRNTATELVRTPSPAD